MGKLDHLGNEKQLVSPTKKDLQIETTVHLDQRRELDHYRDELALVRLYVILVQIAAVVQRNRRRCRQVNIVSTHSIDGQRPNGFVRIILRCILKTANNLSEAYFIHVHSQILG